MDFNGLRILITGAAGFIGSNLTDKFLELGAEVIGLDNLFNGRLSNLEDAFKNKRFEFHKGDVRDLNFLLDLFKDVDIIYHEAAFTS
ncbi:MAG: NAD-dependent epimerase/dehydratase family protein, partial [Promethearchaeota archaeon]